MSEKDAVAFDAELRPSEPLFVVGDVHGRADLLGVLLAKAPVGVRKVFVGDLIDRGDASAKVLSVVFDLCGSGDICIIGNHEQMMLDFLDRPDTNFKTWMRYGGFQTLQSLGVSLNKKEIDAGNYIGIRDQLVHALPQGMEPWLRDLPKHWSSGNVHIVHAGADPSIPIDQQDAQVLQYGCKDFFTKTRADGQWVVHGHTIIDEPIVAEGRIGIDTGAYLSERLSGAILNNGKVDFVST
jgi:serine/threonine protein phosphatase 1